MTAPRPTPDRLCQVSRLVVAALVATCGSGAGATPGPGHRPRGPADHAAAAPAAPASAGATAEALLRQAMSSFDDGQFERSRALLARAHAATRVPALRAQIYLYLGLNAAVEGDAVGARQRFREALTHDPSLRVDPERVKPGLVKAFDEVRRAVVGQLRVRLRAPAHVGAAVWIDGAEVGPPPVTRDLTAGPHLVEIRAADGGAPPRQQVVVRAGEVETLTLALGRLPATQRNGPDGVGASARHRQPAPAPPPRRRLWTWVAGAGALGFLGAAIGTGVAASSDRDAACSLLADGGLPCAERTQLRDATDRARYEDLHQAVETKVLMTNVFYGVAGALAVSSVVLYFLEGRSTETRDTTTRPRRARVDDLSETPDPPRRRPRNVAPTVTVECLGPGLGLRITY